MSNPDIPAEVALWLKQQGAKGGRQKGLNRPLESYPCNCADEHVPGRQGCHRGRIEYQRWYTRTHRQPTEEN